MRLHRSPRHSSTALFAIAAPVANAALVALAALAALAAIVAGAALSGCAGGGSAAPRSRPAPAPAAASSSKPPGRPSAAGPAGVAGEAHRANQANDEAYRIEPRDLTDAVRRAMVGIASLSVGVGADRREDSLPTYTQEGDRFLPAADLQLAATQPVSAFRVGTDAIVNRSQAIVRRYPVLAKQGPYLQIALVPGGGRTAWLRRTDEGSFPDSVTLADLGDAGSLRCYLVDLYWLTGSRERNLYEKPEAGAAFHPISDQPGAPGFRAADIVPLQRKGNFVEIAALHGLDGQRDSLGWVELKDAQGRVSLWFNPGPDC